MQAETATKRLFTVDDYYKIAEAGIIPENQRTELINGEIIEVSPMGPWHASAVSQASDSLNALLQSKAFVRVRTPIRLNELSEPEPDIAVVKMRQDKYARWHPGPADVLLVVEISQTSLRYDCDTKMPTYAAARIPEVWIADLKEQTVLVFQNPSQKTYQTALTLHRGDRISLIAFPELTFAVDELLGPEL